MNTTLENDMIKWLLPNQNRLRTCLWSAINKGRAFAVSSVWRSDWPKASSGRDKGNDLIRWFERHQEGAGIWKWLHYFEMYDQHLAKFRGRSKTLVEIGIYSGGSLDMWRKYLGETVKIVGVDIEPACKRYERPGIEVHIGDQADRGFWKDFRNKVSGIDIVIDDGGHEPDQQIATLEELLPFMNPGAVFVCEDVHGVDNQFLHYAFGLAKELSSMDGFQANKENPDRRLTVETRRAQSRIKAISLYPFAVVIELKDVEINEFVAPKHGTIWEPFLS